MRATSRVSLQPAYLLHRRAYRETSLLLEALSEEYGKVALIAKGVRRSARNGGRLLEPFRLLHLSWVGGGEMHTLTGVEAAEPCGGLAGERLYCGFYLNELLYYLLPRADPVPGVFHLYREMLEVMAGGETIEPALRIFELRLLQELGYGLQLSHEADTGLPIDPAKAYRYLIDAGAVAAGDANLSGATLVGLAQRKLDNTRALREAKYLLRRVIEHHLGGRVLKSRTLFQKLRPSR